LATRRRTFVFPLNKDGSIVLRSRLETERAQVLGFAIQIEASTKGHRAVILRFDTAHGFVHLHSFSESSPEVRTRLQFVNWEDAYTYCYQYAKKNWRAEVLRYARLKR